MNFASHACICETLTSSKVLWQHAGAGTALEGPDHLHAFSTFSLLCDSVTGDSVSLTARPELQMYGTPRRMSLHTAPGMQSTDGHLRILIEAQAGPGL